MKRSSSQKCALSPMEESNQQIEICAYAIVYDFQPVESAETTGHPITSCV
jgi:hypothetical protein